MPEKKFPTSGSLSSGTVFKKFATTSLREACQKIGLSAPDTFPNDFYGKVYLEIQDSMVVSGFSTKFPIRIKVYTDWKISSSVSWITFSQSSGKGNGNVSVGLNVSKNFGRTRSGRVTLTSLGESISMRVTQYGSSDYFDDSEGGLHGPMR